MPVLSLSKGRRFAGPVLVIQDKCVGARSAQDLDLLSIQVQTTAGPSGGNSAVSRSARSRAIRARVNSMWASWAI